MIAKQIQSLNIGDKVKYHNYILEVIGWNCNKDIIMLGNERIWAEPVFKWIDSLSPQTKLNNRSIHPGFWKEVDLINQIP